MKQQELSELVTSYKEKKVRQWILIISLTSAAVFCSIIALSVSQLRCISQLKKEREQLNQELNTLTKTSSERQKQAQELAAFKKLRALLFSPDIAHYGETIAQALPEASFLTSLSSSGQTLVIKGYTETEEELARFVTDLSHSFSNIDSRFTSNLAGITFEITISLPRDH